jgi:glutaredoxin
VDDERGDIAKTTEVIREFTGRPPRGWLGPGLTETWETPDVLADLGYDYAEIPLEHKTRSKIVGAVTGEKTVPQIFVNGKHIGGLEGLERWAQQAA